AARKRWIAFAVPPQGRLTVDAGALAALTRHKKSLLPAGVVEVEGDFASGEVVAVHGAGGREFARGVVNFDAEELRKIRGARTAAALPDPVGTVVESWRRPNGLEISRVRVPLGVIAFIYESRPNVTADAAGLCVKSGNAVLLRGGSEAIESNTLIAAVLARALEKAGGPAEAIQFVETTDREAVAAMLELDGLLDLVIPRGGEEFVRWVAERSRVPVLKHDKGVVHVFVDATADPVMAAQIAVNAK